MCPPNNEVGYGLWWCGIDEGEKACQLGNGGHFSSYLNGSALGFPPITNSSSSATIASSFLLITTIFARPSSKATIAPTSSPAKLPTAIGVAVGIPLGIIAIVTAEY